MLNKKLHISAALVLSAALTATVSCYQPPARSGAEIAARYEYEQNKRMRQVMVIATDYGEILVMLNSGAAREHANTFKDLAENGFFNGLTFHYVEKDKIIQGGDVNSRDDDPSNDGFGDPGFTIKPEVSAKHQIGSVGLAHPPGEPELGNSQFYICLQPMPELDGRYTVFGQVVQGMDVVQEISRVPTDENGHPLKRVEMKVRMDERML